MFDKGKLYRLTRSCYFFSVGYPEGSKAKWILSGPSILMFMKQELADENERLMVNDFHLTFLFPDGTLKVNTCNSHDFENCFSREGRRQ